MKTDRLQSIFKCGDEPVAILGSGMSGQAAQKLLSAKGRVSEFFDEKHRLFESLDAAKCSFVVVSPGFRPSHEWVKLALNAGKEVISEVDLGLVYSKHTELVSITGTNGKTSLASILDHVASRLECTLHGSWKYRQTHICRSCRGIFVRKNRISRDQFFSGNNF